MIFFSCRHLRCLVFSRACRNFSTQRKLIAEKDALPCSAFFISLSFCRCYAHSLTILQTRERSAKVRKCNFARDERIFFRMQRAALQAWEWTILHEKLLVGDDKTHMQRSEDRRFFCLFHRKRLQMGMGARRMMILMIEDKSEMKHIQWRREWACVRVCWF